MEQDVNRHHIWYERKNYFTVSEKTLRNLGGFALDIYAPAHRLLHAQMKPMVKPSRYMIDDIIDVAKTIDNEANRFAILEGTAEHLISKPYGDYELDIRALRLGRHLIQQRTYFDLHPLEIDKIEKNNNEKKN